MILRFAAHRTAKAALLVQLRQRPGRQAQAADGNNAVRLFIGRVALQRFLRQYDGIAVVAAVKTHLRQLQPGRLLGREA